MHADAVAGILEAFDARKSAWLKGEPVAVRSSSEVQPANARPELVRSCPPEHLRTKGLGALSKASINRSSMARVGSLRESSMASRCAMPRAAVAPVSFFHQDRSS